MQRKKSALPKSKHIDARIEESNNLNTHFKLSEAQKTVCTLINNNRIVFVEGVAGTGKTFCILLEFCKRILKDSTMSLHIIRTPVEAGRDQIGFLTGDYKDKTEIHFKSAEMILRQLLGDQRFESLLNKRIFFKVPNYILGSTFDNSLVLVDESQQLEPEIQKLILERMGKNSIFVVAGDRTQLYTESKHKRNGLTDAINRFFKFNSQTQQYESRFKDAPIAHFKFNIEDMQRDDIVKTVIRAYSGDYDEKG